MCRRWGLLTAAVPVSVYGYLQGSEVVTGLLPLAAIGTSALVCATLWTQRRALAGGP